MQLGYTPQEPLILTRFRSLKTMVVTRASRSSTGTGSAAAVSSEVHVTVPWPGFNEIEAPDYDATQIAAIFRSNVRQIAQMSNADIKALRVADLKRTLAQVNAVFDIPTNLRQLELRNLLHAISRSCSAYITATTNDFTIEDSGGGAEEEKSGEDADETDRGAAGATSASNETTSTRTETTSARTETTSERDAIAREFDEKLFRMEQSFASQIASALATITATVANNTTRTARAREEPPDVSRNVRRRTIEVDEDDDGNVFRITNTPLDHISTYICTANSKFMQLNLVSATKLADRMARADVFFPVTGVAVKTVTVLHFPDNFLKAFTSIHNVDLTLRSNVHAAYQNFEDLSLELMGDRLTAPIRMFGKECLRKIEFDGTAMALYMQLSLRDWAQQVEEQYWAFSSSSSNIKPALPAVPHSAEATYAMMYKLNVARNKGAGRAPAALPSGPRRIPAGGRGKKSTIKPQFLLALNIPALPKDAAGKEVCCRFIADTCTAVPCSYTHDKNLFTSNQQATLKANKLMK